MVRLKSIHFFLPSSSYDPPLFLRWSYSSVREEKRFRSEFTTEAERMQNESIKELHFQPIFDELLKIWGMNSFLTYINYYIVCAHNLVFFFADSIFQSNFALERLKRAPACSRRPLSFEYEVLSTLHSEIRDVHRFTSDVDYFLRARMLCTLHSKDWNARGYYARCHSKIKTNEDALHVVHSEIKKDETLY